MTSKVDLRLVETAVPGVNDQMVKMNDYIQFIPVQQPLVFRILSNDYHLVLC